MKRKWLFASMAMLLMLCFAVPAMAAQMRISVKATWNDNDNQDGIRPESVTVRLLENGAETGKSLTLTAGDNWTGFGYIPFRDNEGNDISYTSYTAAVNPVNGYECTVSGDALQGFTITCNHEPETTNISGHVIWNDANNQDGIRPDEVTVRLHKNGVEFRHQTVTCDKNADADSYIFSNLPMYANGNRISYSVTLDAVSNYTTDINPQSHDIINSHTPATTSVSGSILWSDNDNQDGIRPDEVTVRLRKNGTEIQSTTISGNRTDNRWQYAFTNLPKYENGNLVPYSVGEDAVDGYSTDIDNYTITNSHTPAKTSVSFNVAWDDANDQDRKRPESVTVQLFADGAALVDKILTLSESNGWQGSFDNLDQYENGSKITYTLAADNFTGYTRAITGDAASGYTITYSHAPAKTGVWCQAVWNDSNNQDGIRPTEVTVKLLADGGDSGKSLKLNAGNAWTHSFNDLPKYEYGREIFYTIAVTIDDYTSAITGTAITGTATTGYTITNSHTPDTINVAGEITWNDDNDRDRKRPASVTVRLLANAVEVDQKTVSPDANGNWSFSFDGVAKYKNGQPIQYKVYLDSLGNGYSSGTDGYNPIAIRTPDKRSVYGSIIWDDDNDRDGKRPASVIVRVFQGNTELNHQTVTPDANGDWEFSFVDLLKNEDGQPINYTVSMDAVDGYAKNINGYTITNTHVPTTTSLSGWIHWNDDDNRDGIRPQSVTVKLYADGVYKAEETIGAEENTVARGRSARATNWYYSFENLLVNENGRPINYTVEMDPIAGYTTAVQGGSIVNIHEPETTTFRVRKLFKGLSAGEKAPAIQLTLYCNGEEYPTSTPTPDQDGWYVYTVPKRVNGQIAVYTAKVSPIAGFVTGYENVGEYVDQTERLYDGGTSESHRLPKTGDESQLVLWLALAAVACAGVAVLLRKRRG